MLVIFFTNVFTAMLPAYMATFGPALGLRQMTSARYVIGLGRRSTEHANDR